MLAAYAAMPCCTILQGGAAVASMHASLSLHRGCGDAGKSVKA
jgi:hypothetical protein